jgi:hypothetical protein
VAPDHRGNCPHSDEELKAMTRRIEERLAAQMTPAGTLSGHHYRVAFTRGNTWVHRRFAN